jgi:hypothetical protein
MTLTITYNNDYSNAVRISKLGRLATNDLPWDRRTKLNDAEATLGTSVSDKNLIDQFTFAASQRIETYGKLIEYIDQAYTLCKTTADANAGDAVSVKTQLESIGTLAESYTNLKIYGKSPFNTADASVSALSDGSKLSVTCSADVTTDPIKKAAATNVTDVVKTSAYLSNLITLKQVLVGEVQFATQYGPNNPELTLKSPEVEKKNQDALAEIDAIYQDNEEAIGAFIADQENQMQRSVWSAMYYLNKNQQLFQLIFKM